jgi:hypothetical protein
VGNPLLLFLTFEILTPQSVVNRWTSTPLGPLAVIQSRIFIWQAMNTFEECSFHTRTLLQEAPAPARRSLIYCAIPDLVHQPGEHAQPANALSFLSAAVLFLR